MRRAPALRALLLGVPLGIALLASCTPVPAPGDIEALETTARRGAE